MQSKSPFRLSEMYVCVCVCGATRRKLSYTFRGTTLIYLPADIPFFSLPAFQKLWFQPSLSSSYFIRGVRLWANKKLTFSLINSPESLTNHNQSQVLSFPSFSLSWQQRRSSFFDREKGGRKSGVIFRKKKRKKYVYHYSPLSILITILSIRYVYSRTSFHVVFRSVENSIKLTCNQHKLTYN